MSDFVDGTAFNATNKATAPASFLLLWCWRLWTMPLQMTKNTATDRSRLPAGPARAMDAKC